MRSGRPAGGVGLLRAPLPASCVRGYLRSDVPLGRSITCRSRQRAPGRMRPPRPPQCRGDERSNVVSTPAVFWDTQFGKFSANFLSVLHLGATVRRKEWLQQQQQQPPHGETTSRFPPQHMSSDPPFCKCHFTFQTMFLAKEEKKILF